jgi:UDP-glucose 4-epimerase
MRLCCVMGRLTRTVLVTGGAGFVGSHTVDALLAAGQHVVVYDNFSTGHLGNLPRHHPRLRVIRGDIRDQIELDKATRGAAACLHLAAQVSVGASLQDPQTSLAINILGFVNLLESLRRNGVPRLVYASSAAVYGRARSLPLREAATGELVSPYGLEKLTDERYARLYGQLYGLSTLGLRYFNIYGKRQPADSPYSGVITKFAACFAESRQAQIFGDGRQSRDFIHVRDVATANLAALASDFTGVCNIGTGTRTTVSAVFREMRSLSGADPGKLHRPRAAGDIRHSCADTALARRRLGFRARYTFSEGLREMLS